MPYRSPFPSFELPNCDLPRLFYESREKSFPFPCDQVITADAATGEELTFERTGKLARSFARGLKKHLGFQKGDVLCLYSQNHVQI
jgi:4-coumarate--CoA ligase